jgi:hypothetical protein
MVGIIDIGLGNIKSITNWLDRCVVPWKLIYSPEDTQEYHLIILPGVGSVREFMTKLEQLEFTDFINYTGKVGISDAFRRLVEEKIIEGDWVILAFAGMTLSMLDLNYMMLWLKLITTF